jgi:hypothetical protein
LRLCTREDLHAAVLRLSSPGDAAAQESICRSIWGTRFDRFRRSHKPNPICPHSLCEVIRRRTAHLGAHDCKKTTEQNELIAQMQLKTVIEQERRGRRGGTQAAESDAREAVDRIEEAINARRPVPDKRRTTT